MNLFHMISLQIALFIGCQGNIKDGNVNTYSNISSERIGVDLFDCLMLYVTVTVIFSVLFGRPVLHVSNEYQVSVSRTQHRAPGRIKRTQYMHVYDISFHINYILFSTFAF